MNGRHQRQVTFVIALQANNSLALLDPKSKSLDARLGGQARQREPRSEVMSRLSILFYAKNIGLKRITMAKSASRVEISADARGCD
jgi:hypothetical protein